MLSVNRKVHVSSILHISSNLYLIYTKTIIKHEHAQIKRVNQNYRKQRKYYSTKKSIIDVLS